MYYQVLVFKMNELGKNDKTEYDYKISTNLRLKSSLFQTFKKIAQREGRPMTEIINDQIQEYIKIHGSGNPVFSLDNWGDPNFKMTPAFFTENSTWKEYIQKCTPDELREIDEKIFAIGRFVSTKMKYGDVNVRTF